MLPHLMNMPIEGPMKKLLFVCSGNICRSPTAEGVFRHLMLKDGTSESFHLDSCGIGPWHAGSPPDRRSIAAAEKRGIDIGYIRARQITSADFHDFDLLLAMECQHQDRLKELAPPEAHGRIRMLLEPLAERMSRMEVPDPYYGGEMGFELVLDLMQEAYVAWMDKLKTS